MTTPPASPQTTALPPSAAVPSDPRPTSPPAWEVLALGDSVTSGVACDCSAFPDQYADAVSRRVTMHNQGEPGLTSGQLLAEVVDPRSREHELASSADIDIITIGANDFSGDHDAITHGDCPGSGDSDCVADELGQLHSNLAAILGDLQHERSGRPTAILVTGYWNVFEDGDVARSAFPDEGLAASKRLTARVNQVIKAAAVSSGARYVDLVAPFAGPGHHGDPTSLLASDGDHPNAAGHRAIARALLAVGLPGLR